MLANRRCSISESGLILVGPLVDRAERGECRMERGVFDPSSSASVVMWDLCLWDRRDTFEALSSGSTELARDPRLEPVVTLSVPGNAYPSRTGLAVKLRSVNVSEWNQGHIRKTRCKCLTKASSIPSQSG
jgi:hypothetical protein